VALKKNQLAQAASYFCQAQSMEPERDMRATIEYVKAMARSELGIGNWELGNAPEGAADEALASLSALRLMAEGKTDEAEAIWRELQPKAVRTSYGERIGCSMSLIKDSPLAVTGRPLRSALKMITPPAEALQTVKGKVRLKADLTHARNVRIVTFLVDDQLVGVTNRAPFDSDWDTTRWANGRHTVKITGTDDSGSTVSVKTTQVLVDNPVPEGDAKPARDDDSCGLWDRLWDQMRLKPSAAAINYNLALCAQEGGDDETAEAALERVMAANPGYLDASERLSKLYGPIADSHNIYKLNTSDKVVALTFDDGPKPETAALLDALKEKGVKATFFVVGKQAEKYPELVRRMCEEGHEIGNHSYSHYALEYLPTREIEQDVFRCAAVIRSITGREMRLLRPPGAHHGKKVEAVTRKYGMTVVLYSANCSKVEGTAKDKVLRYAVASAQPGAVILMHNLDRVTLQALPEIIDALRAKGYGFVTL
jgi:peptidoglycan/xylan/chitin deacetylase (PgdA/CDA1 family)